MMFNRRVRLAKKFEDWRAEVKKSEGYEVSDSPLSVITFLDKQKLIRPPKDDNFFWDREILESEYPNIISDIRREERSKTIDEICTLLKSLK